MSVCDSVECTSSFEDEETPDHRGMSNVEMLPTVSSDQPRPSISQPRVVSPVYTQPRQTFTATFDDHGTWYIFEYKTFMFDLCLD